MKNKKKMSFLCNIKKLEVYEKKYDFYQKQDTLDENLEIANKIVKVEIIEQNINFLKRLERKLKRKVKK